MRCPCSSGELLENCCGRYIGGQSPAFAPTAVTLMRSRFTAFALGEVPYLLSSWHPDTRPASLDLDPQQRWVHLDILDTRAGGPWDDSGVVRFAAHYRYEGQRGSQEETSRFLRVEGKWYYVDAAGSLASTEKARTR